MSRNVLKYEQEKSRICPICGHYGPLSAPNVRSCVVFAQPSISALSENMRDFTQSMSSWRLAATIDGMSGDNMIRHTHARIGDTLGQIGPKWDKSGTF